MLYSRDIPTGWLAIFRGGLELYLRTDLPEPAAIWSGAEGAWLARWGAA
jgi:hypothetical protein